MSSHSFCLSVIFDQFYVEPAILTAYELITSDINVPLFLIYIESKDSSVSDEIEKILNEFQRLYIHRGLNVIKVNGDMVVSFNKFHFTNSIIYKVLVPKMVECDFILNIDAGFLLGHKAADLINKIKDEINANTYDKSIVAAFCTDSEIDLQSNLHGLPHNSKYPSGIFLLFNTRNYKANDTYARILSSYSQLVNRLVYAEQDLLCLILNEGQLSQLPFREFVIVEFLGLEGLDQDLVSIAVKSKNFAFYKICGVCKPWKYWVLDFRKIFYLRRRTLMEKVFNISNYSVVLKNRHQITHAYLAEKFLENLEYKALNNM